MENTSARLQWIDCTKAVAMAAVATDHCNNLLYTNPAIFKTTAFSVQLFILLSGIVSRKASTKYRYVSSGGGGVVTILTNGLAASLLCMHIPLVIYISFFLF